MKIFIFRLSIPEKISPIVPIVKTVREPINLSVTTDIPGRNFFLSSFTR